MVSNIKNTENKPDDIKVDGAGEPADMDGLAVLSDNPSDVPSDENRSIEISQAEAENSSITRAQDDLSDDNSPLILVVHASVGSGHKSAANAIAKALELIRDEARDVLGHPNENPTELEKQNLAGIANLKDAESLRVEVLDILDFGRVVFDGNATASMFTGVTRPYYDLTWRYTFTGHFLWAGGTIWAHVMYPKFVQYVRDKKPAAIVATHITAANVAVSARMITKEKFPIVCVPTDYEVEGLWPHLHTDLFCVADERMAETLRPRKVPERRIQVTGIPTSPGFSETYDREEERERYGLPQDKQQVLILAGASLPRPYVHFRNSISHLIPYLPTYTNMHMVIVCGRDSDYASQVRREIKDFNIKNATVLDYVDDMPALMASSDLVICKSGGLTVTECLNAGVPMVLLGRAYGQEKANVVMLTATGSALHVTTWRELVGLLHHINDSPEATKAIQLNASFIRRPNAAIDVAKATLRLIAGDRDMDPRLFKRHFMHFYWGGKPAHIR